MNINNIKRDAFYDELEKLAKKPTNSGDVGPFEAWAAGTGAGVGTSFVVAPLERTYNLQQMASETHKTHPLADKSFRKTFANILKEEKPVKELWRGWPGKAAKVGAASGMSFLLYDTLKDMFSNKPDKKK